jgi:DUF4097 and DUF4098 domain-containing protein YvlB
MLTKKEAVMTQRILGLFIAAALVLAAAPHSQTVVARGTQSDDQWPYKDETNQSYSLSRGARVEVSGINGKVEISPGSEAAQVHIIRTAPTEEELTHHRIIVQSSAGSLIVRGESENHSHARVRQHVILTLPTGVQLSVSGVNGPVEVGDIDGPVDVHGVNGRVNIGRAIEHSNISGINGSITISLSQLGEQGMHVSGVNGRINISLADGINADLEVSSINGGVTSELPMTVQGKWGPRDFRARLGSGGPPISISGVNGKISITGLTAR